MKQLLITIAAVVLVGCGESQQTAPSVQVKKTESLPEVSGVSIMTFNTEWLDAQKEIKYSTHYQIFNQYVNSWIFYKEVIPLIPLELI